MDKIKKGLPSDCINQKVIAILDIPTAEGMQISIQNIDFDAFTR